MRDFELARESLEGARVFAAGKAALPMARGLVERHGELLSGLGLVVAPENQKKANPEKIAELEIVYASHPAPDQRSLVSARKLMSDAADSKRGAIVLLSGGASSLVSLPVQGLSVGEKSALSEALMAAGAPISELNTVRRHLSLIKGGQLAKLFAGQVTVLVLSDVVGSAFETVGSGLLSPDPTSAEQARAVLERYLGAGHRLASKASRLLRETPKPAEECFSNVRHFLVASGATLAEQASAAAKQVFSGKVSLLAQPLESEASEHCEKLALLAQSSFATPELLVSYGEPTVRMPNKSSVGRGGRNQHLALLLARRLTGMRGWCFFTAGSDGIDGNSDAAGACVDGYTWQKALELGLDAERALAEFDSARVLEQLGCQIRTGPTGNNLQDLQLFLRDPAI